MPEAGRHTASPSARGQLSTGRPDGRRRSHRPRRHLAAGGGRGSAPAPPAALGTLHGLSVTREAMVGAEDSRNAAGIEAASRGKVWSQGAQVVRAQRQARTGAPVNAGHYCRAATNWVINAFQRRQAETRRCWKMCLAVTQVTGLKLCLADTDGALRLPATERSAASPSVSQRANSGRHSYTDMQPRPSRNFDTN